MAILFVFEKLPMQYSVEFHPYFCKGAEMNKEGSSWTLARIIQYLNISKGGGLVI